MQSAYEPSRRIGKVEWQAIQEHRTCQFCGPRARVRRIAERQARAPHHWVPIGWRCNTCGFCYIDNGVKVVEES